MESEFRDGLNQPRRRGADDLAEMRIVDDAVNGTRSVGLRVIEYVEGFEAKFESL
ncbi:MAG: hypothetical protein ACRD4R_05090 [Candidatus Acidiferrales bacterium]